MLAKAGMTLGVFGAILYVLTAYVWIMEREGMIKEFVLFCDAIWAGVALLLILVAIWI